MPQPQSEFRTYSAPSRTTPLRRLAGRWSWTTVDASPSAATVTRPRKAISAASPETRLTHAWAHVRCCAGVVRRCADIAAWARTRRRDCWLADLARFDQATDLIDGFASFVAVFFGDGCEDEVEFERALWRQLRAIRAVDNADWDPGVSSDVRDPHFSFSAAGAAYFVIGLHPAASRRARWAPHPMLVFNPHEQFEMLRAAGGFERMRDINRRRDKAANGSINPMVADYGDASEACQYSGRLVGPDWCAPFPGSIGVSARHSRG